MMRKILPLSAYDKRLRDYYKKYERLLVPGILLVGFIFDVITFRTLQLKTTFLLLGVHVFLAGLTVMYTNLYDDALAARGKHLLRYLRVLMPLIAQFSFGSLLSASLIFYWYSGAISVSWPIVSIIVILMGTNEVFRQFYLRSAVQMGLFAFVLFSYFSLLSPFIFRSLAPWTFVVGGVASLALVLLLIAGLSYSSIAMKEQRIRMVAVVLSIFASMNTLYLLNVIPPIPLSIRDAGIYNDIDRSTDTYIFSGEEETFFEELIPGQVVHADSDGAIYAYTAIFAPADLTTTIYHEWQFYDESEKKWITHNRLSFDIRGGRDEGYRGYTVKSHLAPGEWRVNVETARGQVLGRVPFTLVDNN